FLQAPIWPQSSLCAPVGEAPDRVIRARPVASLLSFAGCASQSGAREQVQTAKCAESTCPESLVATGSARRVRLAWCQQTFYPEFAPLGRRSSKEIVRWRPTGALKIPVSYRTSAGLSLPWPATAVELLRVRHGHLWRKLALESAKPK